MPGEDLICKLALDNLSLSPDPGFPHCYQPTGFIEISNLTQKRHSATRTSSSCVPVCGLKLTTPIEDTGLLLTRNRLFVTLFAIVARLSDSFPNLIPLLQAGLTGLFTACMNGHFDVVQLLLDRKADANLANQVCFALVWSKVQVRRWPA